MKDNRPNIVVFMPESTRADAVLGKRAARAKTPNMDALAKEGVAFTNCFSQSPFCTPSRCSMFTGLYPHVNGHRSLQFFLQEHERNLFMDLKESGYETAVFGKNDLVSEEAAPLSFDTVDMESLETIDLPVSVEGSRAEVGDRQELKKIKGSFYRGKNPPNRGDWLHAENALRFIGRERDRPFCLFLALNKAHPPYAVEEPFFSLHDRSLTAPVVPRKYHGKTEALAGKYRFRELGKLQDSDLAEIRAVYFGMISMLDYQLGLIIERLARAKLYENTAIFVLSDHGDYAGDYGHVEKNNSSFEDALLNIPLIARVPGAASGVVRKCMVEAVDIYPTLLEIAGVRPKHYQFGRSLMPLLDGTARDVHREIVFAEAGYSKDEKHCLLPLKQYIGSPYEKGIRYSHENPEKTLRGRRVMARTARYKYVYCPQGREEFYDLRKDPNETSNAASSRIYEPVKKELREKLLKWFLETSDTVSFKHDKRSF